MRRSKLSIAEHWLVVAVLAVCGTFALGALVHTEVAIGEVTRWVLECK